MTIIISKALAVCEKNIFHFFHLAANENKMKCVYCGSLKCDVFVSRALIHY